MRHFSTTAIPRELCLAAVLLIAFLAVTRAENKPSILFAVPGENRYAYVGFDYMRSLADAGFAVDYVEGAHDFTWDRVKKYNVVVVLDFPGATTDNAGATLFSPSDAGRLNDYFAVLEKFRAAGGGILLHYSPSEGGGAPNRLLSQWGLQFPIQFIHDSRSANLTQLNDVNTAAFTDQIAASPVSDGVRQIWYPIGRHYAGWHTMPIIVDSNWQPVVRASKTAWTEVPVYTKADAPPPPGALVPAEPIKDPVLFAIRDGVAAGRLAAVQTWHQFSIGSGMKFLYNNEILEKGLNGESSQYGRLLLNTYHWLAEPSLKSNAVGGYAQDPNRLLETQAQPNAAAQFPEQKLKDLQSARTDDAKRKIYRGMIGAQTSLSGGEGTVDDYAKAATDAGLDYLVILEDFAGMTSEKLDQLKAAVKKASTPTLRLYAGYRMKNNIGNEMCIYGINPPWPPDKLLTGPHHDVYNLQFQDENGKYVQSGEPLDFLISMAEDAFQCTVGYFNFSRSGPTAMQMHDLRAYSAAAVRTYENGKLVDDATADYRTTWGATIGPVPFSMNLLRSPQELRDAAKTESLTYAQARSLDLLWQDALRWNGSYDGPNVFVSDGPIVQQWPTITRATTFGAEPFVPGRSLQDAPIDVKSDAGLKEIRIYNGPDLFRRFVCAGAKEFRQELFLPAVLNQNLTLVAEDNAGKSAITYPLRTYKEGVIGPIFCSDHVNDCGYMLLAHGPIWPRFSFAPSIPNAGQTWDGGPLPLKELLTVQQDWPQIDAESKLTEWQGAMPYQTPMLEFADEGATRCRMSSDRKLADGPAAASAMPWMGYGPIEPTKLADAWASVTVFNPFFDGVDPLGWGGPGTMRGPVATLFTQKITFKASDTIDDCLLFQGGWRGSKLPASVQFVTGHGGQIIDEMDASVAPDKEQNFRIDTGDWFAFYSACPSNTAFVINRGPPVRVQFPPTGTYWMKIFADFDKKAVKPGDKLDSEFFTITWPMDEKVVTAADLARVATYLAHPAGIQITRGKQSTGAGGLLELAPDDYAAELSIPQSPSPMVVPVRVGGLNKRWSAGLYQFDGFRSHYYSKGNSGYRAVGLDMEGRAYVPMHVGTAPLTHDLIGHPVVADDAGKDLFIQATCLPADDEKNRPNWSISVNNPTDQPVTATFHRAMDIPGLVLSDIKITLQPGEYRVIENR